LKSKEAGMLGGREGSKAGKLEIQEEGKLKSVNYFH